MSAAPSFESLGLLLGLSFFLGLAFEDFFAQAGTKRPGGVRTFPLLALAGGMLYLFDPVHLIPYTGGLLVLGAWLAVFYREHIRERDEQGEPQCRPSGSTAQRSRLSARRNRYWHCPIG